MNTIKSSTDISRLFNEGKRISTRDLTFIILETKEEHDPRGRVAFVAGKKLGNAVWRNRAKRRMRSLYNDLNIQFIGFDVVFLAKRSINISPYNEIIKRAKKVLNDTCFLKNS